MASRAELEQQAAQQAAVIAAAWAQLLAGWAALDLTAATAQTPEGIQAVSDLFGDLLLAWGEVASTLAADFYDDHRERAVGFDGYSALVRDPLNVAQVERLTSNALKRLDSELTMPDSAVLQAMLGRLEGPAQRLVRQAYRDTLDEAAARDPRRPRVARVPTGTETCAFCLVLASRGYVYRSLASAGRDNAYHDFCECELDLSWSATPEPPDGYDPGELYGKYDAARKAAGTGDLRKVLKELRLLEGVR